MEPESSLPYSQAPANCPYPEPTPAAGRITSWKFPVTIRFNDFTNYVFV